MSVVRQPLRFGALSLLMLVVCMVIATLSVLSYTTAHASMALTEREAQTETSRTQLDALGQEWVAQIDGILQSASSQNDPQGYIERNLPENSTYADGAISTHISDDSKNTLDVSLRIDEGYRYHVVEWVEGVDWQADETIGNLYTG